MSDGESNFPKNRLDRIIKDKKILDKITFFSIAFG
jgi:hypothetical protein